MKIEPVLHSAVRNAAAARQTGKNRSGRGCFSFQKDLTTFLRSKNSFPHWSWLRSLLLFSTLFLVGDYAYCVQLFALNIYIFFKLSPKVCYKDLNFY